ncbi:MAG: sulfur relay protein DsrC [Gammaproteobacteria bacterium]
MLWLSEVLLQHHELESFAELVNVIQQAAGRGEMFFRMDIRPSFPDTPGDWEDRLEAAFTTPIKPAAQQAEGG